MKWIGLSGGLASGKSTVANFLRRKGFSVLDADQIAKDVLQNGTLGLQKVVETFGKDLIGSDGELNRQKMAQVVFNSPSDLQKLEAIVHPLVQAKVKETRKKLEEKGTKIAFYDVPLLFEKNLQSQFDATVLVSCSETLQRSRMKSRNRWSDEEIEARLKAQLPLAKKEKLAKFIIHNNSDLDQLETQVELLLKSLQKN
ncbi:MAG: dephospho-CoA kinase [Bdellovibrionota bacterium]